MENSVKTAWGVDAAHSEVTFKVKHMMISSVSGQFGDFTATAETEGDDFTKGTFAFSARIDSIQTGNTDRDNHLKSGDFFDAEAFPELRFQSTSFDGSTMAGELTIKDVTKTVELDVEFNGIATDPYGQVKAGFEISGKVNRKEFGLTWDAVTEAGNVVVSDEVKLQVDLQLQKS